MAKEVVLTQEGFESLKIEIEELSTTKRREVAERIKEAREFGDISENSEYDDAKNEQAMLEARISGLEEKLREARIVDASELSSDVVQIGSTITLKADAIGKQTFQLVGSAESDPDAGRISNESPVGRAILGHKKGETVEVATPGGSMTYTIVSISA